MLKVYGLTVLLLLVSAAAGAGPAMLNGIYVVGGLGYGQTALSRPSIASAFNRNGFAWTAALGYQVNNFLAAEAGYVNMRNVVASGIVSGQSVRATVVPYFVYFAAKGLLPIHGGFYLFVKLGGAYAEGKQILQIGSSTTVTSAGKIVAYGSTGISYAIRSNLILSTEVSTTLKRGIVPRMTVGTVNLAYVIRV